jgi:hypothetical protein
MVHSQSQAQSAAPIASVWARSLPVSQLFRLNHKEQSMSSTHLINQAVSEQRHASEHQSRSPQRRGSIGSSLWRQLPQNVGGAERQISLATGAVLAGLGLTRGGLTGLAMLGLGGALAFRGATGYCSVYNSLGLNSTNR